jgi:hypothetical protein
MNIRQCRGSSCCDELSFPHIVPASQAIFLAVGMLVPATDRRGLGTAKEHPSMPDRRDALVAAVAAHNRSHKPLPHSTVRVLEAMFAGGDVCQQSLQELRGAAGLSDKSVQAILRALLAAGVIAKEETGHGQHANRYRIHLLALVQS